MIHSVFELGDTVAREVMVPRTDMVTIDRQQVAAFGDVAVPALGVLPHPGGRRGSRRRARAALLQGRGPAGQRRPRRDVRCPSPSRCGPCTSCPRASRSTTCCARCSATRAISPWWSTSTAGRRASSPSRTSSRRSSERSPTSTTARRRASRTWGTAGTRVPATLPIDDLAELFDVEIDEDEVDTVGGLIAKQHRPGAHRGVALRGGGSVAHRRTHGRPSSPHRHASSSSG